MIAHRAVIAAGPGAVSRLCCGSTEIDDGQLMALAALDDPVVLVDERPVAVGALWRAVLRSLTGGHRGVLVLHPSWWSPARVAVVSAAARAAAGDEGVVRARSWLLAQPDSTMLVEIAERLVAICGSDVVAVPRLGDEQAVADEVGRVITTMTGHKVVIDASSAVPGAPRLARLITGALANGRGVTTVDDTEVTRLARAVAPVAGSEAVTASRGKAVARLAVAGVTVTAAGLALPAVKVGDPAPSNPAEPATVLVEGDLALTIPAGWITQRVTGGPGSARVQITSPSDPEAALHITQTPTPGETLADAADRLRRAIDAAPAGIFVDFNPSGASAGRPAVTYREVRAAHDVRWTVLLDGSLRISIGCQSRPAAVDAVRDACEQAVRTAHAVG